jgi:hypothetical protein
MQRAHAPASGRRGTHGLHWRARRDQSAPRPAGADLRAAARWPRGRALRIIYEYALDAVAELDAAETGFTEADHAWVHAHASGSLAEIEKATLRLVAVICA